MSKITTPSKSLNNKAVELCDILDAIPELRVLKESCQHFGKKHYYVANVVRDYLLNIPGRKECDIFIECSPGELTQIQAYYLNILNHQKITPSYYLDIKPCKNVFNQVNESDFTLNTIILDIDNQVFIDLLDGISHLEKQELHFVSELFFITCPRSFFRAFRLSAQLDFTIAPDTLKLIQQYVNLIHLAPSKTWGDCLVELLRLLSLKNWQPAFELALESQVIAALLPEVLISDKPKRKADFGRYGQKRFMPLMKALDTQLDTFPEGLKAHLSEPHRLLVGKPENSELKTLPFTPLSIIRLCLLYTDVGQDFILQFPDKIGKGQESALTAVFTKQLLLNLSERCAASNYLSHMAKEYIAWQEWVTFIIKAIAAEDKTNVQTHIAQLKTQYAVWHWVLVYALCVLSGHPGCKFPQSHWAIALIRENLPEGSPV